jgi:putative oxidoreductase
MADQLRFLPALGRLMISIIFITAGYGKLTDFAGAVAYAEPHMPMPSIGIAAAIIVELGGGILLVLGFKARWVAAAIAIFSIAAAFLFHFEPFDQINFWKNFAIAGGLLQIVYFGAGPLSIDSRGK